MMLQHSGLMSQDVTTGIALMEKYIGFKEIEDGINNICFCDLLIGRFFKERCHLCIWNKV